MLHDCKTCVLYCMDWRLGPGGANIDELLIKDKVVDSSCFDRVVIGGGVKNLSSAQEESDIAFTLRQLDIADKLHHVSKIVLINHTDCGAYGGSQKFKNSDEEHSFHYNELRKAAQLIKTRYPNIELSTYLAHLTYQDQHWSVYLVRI